MEKVARMVNSGRTHSQTDNCDLSEQAGEKEGMDAKARRGQDREEKRKIRGKSEDIREHFHQFFSFQIPRNSSHSFLK